jgi:hypothetical protein
MAGAATQPAAAEAAPQAGHDNSVDAQERAIVQNGWKNPAPPNPAH